MIFDALEGSSVSVILIILQKYWNGIYIYIFLIAVLPPLMAIRDRNKSPDAVKKGYIYKNLFYNLFGSACPYFFLILVHQEIEDFTFIELYPIDEIINMLIPVCFWLALSYQSMEQENEELNHSASLVWMNQKCNILHLFNTYFWSLVSAVFIVVYILYCYVHNQQIHWNNLYIVFLAGVLFSKRKV